MDARMEFKYGDNQTHYFRIPESAYNPGGTLYFVAKPEVDNDPTDARAVINKSFTDAAIIEPDHDEYVEGKVTWELAFGPTDIKSIDFEGAKSMSFLGEFSTTTAGTPTRRLSYPADDNFIDVTVYADIKRG